jgi:hypothetical protein
MLMSGCVLIAGLAVGAVAYHAGVMAATLAVLAGASGTALVDAAGILWPRHSAGASGRRGDAGARPDMPPGVLWLMLRDTFQVTVLIIALVGGITYMVLAMLAWSGHLPPD